MQEGIFSSLHSLALQNDTLVKEVDELVDVFHHCLLDSIVDSLGVGGFFDHDVVLDTLLVGDLHRAVLANLGRVPQRELLLVAHIVLEQRHLLLTEQLAVTVALPLVLALRQDRLQLGAHQVLGAELLLAGLGIGVLHHLLVSSSLDVAFFLPLADDAVLVYDVQGVGLLPLEQALEV